MNDPTHHSAAERPGRTLLALLALLPALLSVVHGVVASYGVPVFDDALIELMMDYGGPDLVAFGHRETPLYAQLMAQTLRLGVFWQLSTVALVLAWTAVGLFAAMVAIRLGCTHPLGVVTTSVLAATGMQAQYYMNLSTVWAPLVIPVVVWAAVLSLPSGEEPFSEHKVRYLASLGALLFAATFTVYALPATLAALTVVVKPWRTPNLKRAVLPALLACFSGLTIWFLAAGDGGDRPAVSLASLSELAFGLLQRLPLALINGAWHGTVGLLFARMGAITLLEARKAILFGALLVGVAVLAARLVGTLRASEDRLGTRWTLAALGVLIALLPVVLAGRAVGPGLASRYFLTALPLFAALVGAGLHHALRPRFRAGAYVVILFVSGYWFEVALDRHLDRGRTVRDLSGAVERAVGETRNSELPTVVLVQRFREGWPYQATDWLELTSAYREFAVDPERSAHVILIPTGEAPDLSRPQSFDLGPGRALDVFTGTPDRIFYARQDQNRWVVDGPTIQSVENESNSD